MYFHSKDILEFFQNWPNQNNLLLAVKEDISDKLYLAEVRALGIIDKIIIGPLWRIIELQKCILEKNPLLLTLKMKLSELCKNESSIMILKTPTFSPSNVNIHKDILYNKLFEETN